RGETRVGRAATADLVVPPGAEPAEAADASLVVITISADGAASLQVSEGDAGVFVNGVPVGREPAPLLHGDRVAIDGCELCFADEAQSGETQEIPAASEVRVATPSAGIGEARSRGRLVSLTDGREYAVPAEGLNIGRDAGCDVVVASPNVSRRHARLIALPHGYELLDSSRNGVFVNGARVQGALALARGDTVRVGNDEFRFYADAEPALEPRSLKDVPSLQMTGAIPAMKRAATPPPPGTDAVSSVPAPSAPRSLEEVPSLQRTMAIPTLKRPTPSPAITAGPQAPLGSAPSTVKPASGGSSAAGRSPSSRGPALPLAVLEVLNEGASKGTRFELHAPLTHVGRGAYNDVVVLDESVSEAHAKIQRREDAWYLVDMDSTNGTYMAGTRVYGEARLTSGSDVRFGGIKMSFRILGGGQRTTGETRVIVGVRGPDPKRAEQRLKELARGVEPMPAEPPRRGVPVWIWGALVALFAFFLYLVLQGR
ncbi:MAG TPA: FHA domain-containing protein, partial [Gemmatimonadaceae bacterium]|nr:FHA domain-containing protein [Gemmatimonadaceae bacterium]